LKLTQTRELGKYIAFIDYHIPFDELPLSLTAKSFPTCPTTYRVFPTTSAANVLFGAADNGMAPPF